MSRYTAFCNNNTDLQGVLANINDYDRKRVLPPNWTNTTLAGVSASNVYYIYNSGYVSQLYMDGAEMTAVTDTPNANNEFSYTAATDLLTIYKTSTSATILNSAIFEAGQDWDSLKTTVCKEQADRIRSFINRPIYKRNNSTYKGASDRDYDWILIRINAILAVADLVRSGGDIEAADEIESMATNEDGTGLMDKLQRREYCLWNETAWRTENGVIQEVSVDGSSTGYIEDIKLHGPPGVDYDEVKVIISQAGTFAAGSASTVKYDVYVKDSTGLKTSKVVSSEVVNGDYQELAYGAQIRFQTGVYTSNDEWAVIFQSDELPIGSIKSGQIYR